jgi:hypothetical protein
VPENAYRRGHLYSHLAASTVQPYTLTRIRRLHPGWPDCAAGCGWPLDPAARAGGYDRHPACDQPAR